MCIFSGLVRVQLITRTQLGLVLICLAEQATGFHPRGMSTTMGAAVYHWQLIVHFWCILALSSHIAIAGQSNPPNHLSMFLEVTDSKAGSSEWSCFVSHRLSVVNQKFEGDRYTDTHVA